MPLDLEQMPCQGPRQVTRAFLMSLISNLPAGLAPGLLFLRASGPEQPSRLCSC
jgi:hypothetical protein